jgi:hypothetical protein
MESLVVDNSGGWAAQSGMRSGSWCRLCVMGEFTAPLRGSAALAAGLMTRGQLRGPGFRRLFPDVYLPVNVVPTLAMRSRGAYLLVAGHGALAGYSAAELLGARIASRDADVEEVVEQDLRVYPGLRVHREQLAEDEIETVGGLVVTSAVRTAYDLAAGRRWWRVWWRPMRSVGSGDSDHRPCSYWRLATLGLGGAAESRW